MDRFDELLRASAPPVSSDDARVRAEIVQLATSSVRGGRRRQRRPLAVAGLSAALVIGGGAAAAQTSGWIDLFGWQPDRVSGGIEECYYGLTVTADGELGTEDPGYRAALAALQGLSADDLERTDAWPTSPSGGGEGESEDSALAAVESARDLAEAEQDMITRVHGLIADEVSRQGLGLHTWGLKAGTRCLAEGESAP